MAENKCLTSNRAGVVVPIVDFNRCEGKDACVVVCPYDVFEVRKIDKDRLPKSHLHRKGQEPRSSRHGRLHAEGRPVPGLRPLHKGLSRGSDQIGEGGYNRCNRFQ